MILRGAIIGLGKIAQTGHLPAYGDSRITERAEIVAAVDPSIDARDAGRRLFPNLRIYETVDQLFAKEKVDFIDITTPPHLHAALIAEGIARGVHVLCEKPFAHNLEDAGRTVELLKKHSLVFMPCHQYHLSPIWSAFKHFIEKSDSRAGWFLQFNIYRTQADPGSTHWNSLWRTDQSISGGGILADTGVHYLYLTLWLMGFPGSIVAKTSRLQLGEGAVEDTAIVVAEFDNGLTEINLTWGADQRANSARLVTRQGSVVYDGTTLAQFRNGTKELLQVPDASDKTQYIGLYVSLFDEFLRRVETGQPSAAWIDEAFQSVQLLQACYESARTSQTIILNQ